MKLCRVGFKKVISFCPSASYQFVMAIGIQHRDLQWKSMLVFIIIIFFLPQSLDEF